MSLVPDVAVSEPVPELVVRPLSPAIPCTLALVEHRDKPNEPALEIVRDALLTLRSDDAAGSILPSPGPRSRRADRQSLAHG
jgi:hypothetical protein